MTLINPYLNFKGNCEEAFLFYQSIFGGEFSYIGRFSEMPPQEGFQLPEEWKNKIMHISLPISKEITLLGSDTGGEWAPNTIIGNNISLSISVDSKNEADCLFEALSKKGKINMPLAPTFWGEYFGMCSDPFEINWMVSYRENSKEH